MSTALLLLLLVNGLLSTDGQSSDDDVVDNAQSTESRLMKLELAMAELQLENGAIKEELNKQQNTSNYSAEFKRLETNLTLLQDLIEDLQDINVTNHLKLSLLQDELQASRNELSELRALVSLLQKNIVKIMAQLVGTKHNMTLMQQSIKWLLENTSFLMDSWSSMDDDKLTKLTQLVSTLQSLIVTLESRHLQFESLSTANHSWLSKRIDEVDQKWDTSTDQLLKKNRKQDRQLKKMVVQVTDLKQQVDELVNDTVIVTTGCSTSCHNGGSCGSDGACKCTMEWTGSNCSERIYPRSCEEQYSLHPQSSSGVYQLQFSSSSSITPVYCQLATEHPSLPPQLWTVVQRRSNGSVNFTRPWDDYVKGFGDPGGDYWMGLENMHTLTTRGCKLMVVMEDYTGNRAKTVYASMTVRSSVFNYELGITVNWTGTAGDSLSAANGVGFSTYDRDHDRHYLNCARLHGSGGWWYTDCGLSRLNGRFAATPHRDDEHLTWHSWKRSDDSLKNCSMMISCSSN